jgi:diguanylate cyclase (GGDEF)-like protein
MSPERPAPVPTEPPADFEDTILTRRLESPAPCRVLIADEDELVRTRLAALLRGAAFEPALAASGGEALRILQETPCQILLTDWEMPDMDGLALCRRIRATQTDGYVYIVMLTVRSTPGDVLTGFSAGVDDFVVKGTSVHELLARLEVARRITHIEHSLRASNRENRRLSFTDALTGAYNLRYFVKHLPRELIRAQRYGHPLAVLSCDIDEFKQVNDRYGHQAGDALLRAFVARADSCIRKDCDWLARVGGDEFMLVLPETNTAGAHDVARKLRRRLALQPVPTAAGPVRFAASIGITAVEAMHDPDSFLQIEDLLRAVDEDLYLNKREGADSPATSKVQRGGSNRIN